MVASKYDIIQINKERAKVIWNDSPQSNVFTHPEVLEEFSKEVHWWLILKGEEEQCIWPVTLDETQNFILPPFSYWQGPTWSSIGYDFPNHRSISKVKPIYELFFKTFISEYGIIKASLHPSLIDVRVFDWWNFNKPNSPKFEIKPRYTAIIKDLEQSIEELKTNFRTDRRQALKKFEKIRDKIYFDDSCTEDEFISLYKHKLKIEKSVSNEDLVSLLNVVKKGFGWIQASRTIKDSQICGLMIIFYSHKCANLVINIAKNEYKKEGLIPGSILNALTVAKGKGLKQFDFNGANSPHRGDDKHSYDAEPVLYFDVEFKA